MWFDSQLEVKVSSDSDYIHDISYNYYGNRLAMCTSGQKISVWDRDDSSGSWTETCQIDAAHSAPIWRVDWAHAEFGQVLASCSNDGHVHIWSEKRKGDFVRNARFVDAARTVTDVKFAPKKFGLKLATCALDGFVRVYEAQDVLNLATWGSEDIDCHPRNTDNNGSTCLSWIINSKDPTLAIGGNDGTVHIYARGPRNRWDELASDLAHQSGVKDCAWAPNLCRPYEILATCGSEENCMLWKWESDGSSGYSLTKLQALDCGEPALWRVDWNITGTLLAVSPESGQVSVWKTDASNKWFNACDIATPQN